MSTAAVLGPQLLSYPCLWRQPKQAAPTRTAPRAPGQMRQTLQTQRPCGACGRTAGCWRRGAPQAGPAGGHTIQVSVSSGMGVRAFSCQVELPVGVPSHMGWVQSSTGSARGGTCDTCTAAFNQGIERRGVPTLLWIALACGRPLWPSLASSRSEVPLVPSSEPAVGTSLDAGTSMPPPPTPHPPP